MTPDAPCSPLIFVISGPAGSGKTTLCDRLIKDLPNVQRLVTSTTRAPRPGECDGVDYHFLSEQAFRDKIAAGEFIEWACVHGRYYGSQRAHAIDLLNNGSDVLLNIDVQGAEAFRSLAQQDERLRGRVHTLFIQPASEQQLIERLKARGSDGPEEIQRRLISARKEMSHAQHFDHIIHSSSKEEDFARFKSLFLHLRKNALSRSTTAGNKT